MYTWDRDGDRRTVGIKKGETSMQLIQLQDNVWVIQGGANIGVIAHEGRCLLIDSGMDKDVGREIPSRSRSWGWLPARWW